MHVVRQAILYAILSNQRATSADRSAKNARASVGAASVQLAAHMCSAHRNALAAAGKQCWRNARTELVGNDLRAKDTSIRFPAA